MSVREPGPNQTPPRFIRTKGPALLRNGYSIVPIPLGAKGPRIKDWPNIRADEQKLVEWITDKHQWGVGVLTRETPAVDIDVYDEDIARGIARWCFDNIGKSVGRVGKPPKRLIVYRAEKPFPKQRSNKYRSPDGNVHQIEILGNGQQFVAYHIHPETGKPYTWLTGEPIDRPASSLPLITLEKVQALFAHFDEMAAQAGWVLEESGAKGQGEDHNGNPSKTTHIRTLKEAMQHVPNDDLHYDDWIRVGIALRAAVGDRECEGLELFHEWSAKSAKYYPETTEAKWNSFPQKGKAGAGTIFYLASQNGWERSPIAAADEFDPVPYVMPTRGQQRVFDAKFAERKAGAMVPVAVPLSDEQLDTIARDVARELEHIGRNAARLTRRFLSISEMRAMPEPEWLVEGLLQKRTAALMFGTSNAFKSFLAIDVGLSVATGRDWHGHQVSRTPVAFVATEGANGVGRLRVPGWLDHYKVPREDQQGIFLLPAPISLDSKADVDWLIHELRRLGAALLVLDILKGTISGSEIEDTTAAAWVEAAQRIISETGATVLAVAHTGWQDKSRARMHTHLWGSFDTRLQVEGDKDTLTACLSVERHKDADSTGSWGFRLESSHGTLVPVLDADVRPGRASRWPRSTLVAAQALDAALAAEGEVKTGPGWPSARVVPLRVWREYCFREGITKSEQQRGRNQAFSRVREDLLRRGAIRVFEDHVWSTFDQ